MRHKASVSKTERKSFNEPSLDWAHIVLYASATTTATTTTTETGSNSNCNNNESCQQIARKSHKPFTTTTAQRNAASSMMPSVLNVVLIALIDIVVDVLPPATITKRFLCTTALLFIPLDWLRCAPPPSNSFCLGVRQGVLILSLPLPVSPASKADKAKTASIV